MHELAKPKIEVRELFAVVGIELASALVGSNSLSDLWSDLPFIGNDHFRSVMSRDRFMIIRSNLQLNQPVTEKNKSADPYGVVES